MVTHISKPKSAPGDGCILASLDSRDLQIEDYTDHLSARERTTYMGLACQSRKSRWLAGRLAAKYLFLNRLEMLKTNQGRPWTPRLSMISSRSLRAYSPWMYQNVEVVTSGSKPSLAWCRQACVESLSLSHSGSVSCASIAFGGPTVIDLESTVPRVDAFYRSNFTAAERAWVARGSGGEPIKANWLFTLLWSFKESALKLGWLDSLWKLPRVEIAGLPSPDDLGSFSHGQTISDDFAVFTVKVKHHCRARQVRVAVTGTRNFILSVMNAVGVVK